MSRVAGVSGKHLREVAEQLGWTLDHWRGDHMLFKKAGERLTISIPTMRRSRPERRGGSRAILGCPSTT